MTCHFFPPALEVSVLWQETIHSEAHNTVGPRRAHSVQWLHYGPEDQWIVVRFLVGARVLLSKAPRLAIKLTQPPIQGVSGAPFLGESGRDVNLFTSLHPVMLWMGGALPPLSILFDFVQEEIFTLTQYRHILHWIL